MGNNKDESAFFSQDLNSANPFRRENDNIIKPEQVKMYSPTNYQTATFEDTFNRRDMVGL